LNGTVSVIIPAYNAGRYIEQAIRSCLAQGPALLEVIVVDDGSADDTAAVVRRFGPPLRYLRQDNAGPSTARNRGIQESRGEFVAFLDADDWWEPTKLSRQLDCFRTDTAIGLVHTGVIEHDESRNVHWVSQTDRRSYTGRCTDLLFRANRIVASSVIVRRHCFDRVGLFDPSVRGAEDLDLWLRIGREFPMAFVDEPLVHYRRHESNSSRNAAVMAVNHFIAIEKAWHDDRELRARIGVKEGRRHLSEVAFYAAYQSQETGQCRQARRYFGKSLRYRPFSPKAIGYWTASLLPPRLHAQLRKLKQRWMSSSSATATSVT
jgi:glycosyltransferase involved in cell wall biosynthesis